MNSSTPSALERHTFFFEASKAADSILRGVYRVRAEKADLDPLDHKDFEKICVQLGHELKQIAGPIDTASLNAALQALDVDWKGMSDVAKSKVIAQASKMVGAQAAAKVLPKIEQPLDFHAKDLVQKTKSKAILKYNMKIDPSYTAIDQRVVDMVSQSQAHFVTDAYGNRSDKFSNIAKKTVAEGLAQGLGSKEISDNLKFGTSILGKQDSYWTMIAMVFANRARTTSQLFSFAEAAIEVYLWDSVLDQVTSMQCRFLHGRKFSVPGAIASIRAVEDADDPMDVKKIQPFLNMSGNKLYVGSADDPTHVATITQNVVGQPNKKGSYTQALGTSAIENLGIRFPPIHGHCRSTVIPQLETSTVSVPENVPAPPPYQPPPQTPKQIKQDALSLINDFVDHDTGFMPTSVVFKMPEDVEAAGGLVPHEHFFDGKYNSSELQEIIDLNAVSKKPALNKIFASEKSVDANEITALVNSPKKLKAEPTPTVVKYKDQMWIYSGHESLVAQRLLGQKAAYVRFVDLDKSLKLPTIKPTQPVLPHLEPPAAKPPAPTIPTHPPATSPAAVLHAPTPAKTEASAVLGQKLSGAQGSNEGGIYRGTDGVERYVKFYKDASQAPGEHLANNIYKALGHEAPTSSIFEHEGAMAYASNIIAGAKTLNEVGLTQDLAKQIMNGVVGDMVVGNWDAVGMSLDNIVVKDGKIIRIDNGGTFLMRAKAGRKPDAALNALTEWDKFFDSSVNPSYAKIARAAGYDSAEEAHKIIAPQIQKLIELRNANGGWAGYVEKTIDSTLPAADKQKMITMLEKRTDLLEQKLPSLLNPPKKPAAGRAFEAPAGVRVKPPEPDAENLAVRRVEDLPKRKLPRGLNTPPDGSTVDEYRERAHTNIKKAPVDARSAISDFTDGSYSAMRAATSMSKQDFERQYGAGSYERWRAKAELAESAFERVPPVPGQVFRGISNISREVVDQLCTQDEISMLGTASTTRTADVAINNFMGGTSGPGYRALFVLHQKSAIAIETISHYKTENEILVSQRARFRILNRHVATDNPHCLIVECEELTDAFYKGK